MHIYAGWRCQTPGCSDEILFAYMGQEPLRGKINVKVPASVIVECRTCHRKHEYSDLEPQTFAREEKLSDVPDWSKSKNWTKRQKPKWLS